MYFYSSFNDNLFLYLKTIKNINKTLSYSLINLEYDKEYVIGVIANNDKGPSNISSYINVLTEQKNKIVENYNNYNSAPQNCNYLDRLKNITITL